jgi:hypothetical protein
LKITRSKQDNFQSIKLAQPTINWQTVDTAFAPVEVVTRYKQPLDGAKALFQLTSDLLISSVTGPSQMVPSTHVMKFGRSTAQENAMANGLPT